MLKTSLIKVETAVGFKKSSTCWKTSFHKRKMRWNKTVRTLKAIDNIETAVAAMLCESESDSRSVESRGTYGTASIQSYKRRTS